MPRLNMWTAGALMVIFALMHAVAAQTVAEAVAVLDGLDQLELEDFGKGLLNVKFEQKGDRPTRAEIDAHVAAFLDELRKN